MKVTKKRIRTRNGLKEYTYLGCPLTHNRSAWCFRLCLPDEEGNGHCGRLAPHSLKSRTQLAIEDHKKKVLEVHLEKLEHMYLAAPCNEYYDPGISVTEGGAEIVIPVQDKFCHAAGAVHGSVYFKALDDAAFFAVNSIVSDVFVLTVNFDTYLASPVAAGNLVARGRFLGVSGDQYLADSVLTDSAGKEIGRGNGVFMKSRIPLSPDIGYGRL